VEDALVSDSRRDPQLDVVCSGEPYEMGRQQGATLRDRIRDALAAVSSLEAFRLRKPTWLPFPLFRRLAEHKSSRFVSAGRRNADVAAFERLAGIAEGAGIHGRRVQLFAALEAMMSDVCGTTAAAPGCSAVALSPNASSSGRPVVAHNFDYLPLVQPFYTLRESRPTGRLRSLEFTAAPLAGSIDGVNEAGLAITCNYAYVTDRADPAPTITMMISEALADCRSVDEAVAFLGGRPRFGGGILMLADAGGDVASLELSCTRSAVRRPEPGEDRLFHTNLLHCAEMKAVEISPTARHTQRAPRALRGVRLHESSERRNDRFRNLLFERDRLSTDDLHAIMSDHGESGVPDRGTICMHSDYWTTTACVQLMPVERAIHVSYSTACTAAFGEFAL
jgi:Acyl-coenzyme A:6-aminopenicillanic acid acyl-transferase